MHHFNTIVIGAGLMGVAATKYLSSMGEGVAVIGPAEPGDQSGHRGVFASHYDQGRLTSRLSKSVIWSRIARHAIDGYRALEAESGIPFYQPMGRIAVDAPHAPDEETVTARRIADAEGISYRFFAEGDQSWRNRFPYLDFPAECSVLHEPDPAGCINPRAMLRAQLTVAESYGATILRKTAVQVKPDAGGVIVQTDDGTTYHAGKLLIAAGAFTNFNSLLPSPIPLKLKTETIVLGRVSPETATALDAMPVVTYQIVNPEIDDIYMTPPLRYPDGNHYVKMGCNTRADTWPATLDEVQRWFREGDSDACKTAMDRALRAILPSVPFLSMETRRCIVCYTPSGLPTIDALSDRIFVAAGGNGSGAKVSDTLGKLAAGLLHDGRWPDDIERGPFLIREGE